MAYILMVWVGQEWRDKTIISDIYVIIEERETRERLSTGRTGEASKIPREMCKEAHFLRCDPEPASLCALDTLFACLILVWLWLGTSYFLRLTRDASFERWHFSREPNKEISQVSPIQGKNILRGENHMCKGPEAGGHTVCLRKVS